MPFFVDGLVNKILLHMLRLLVQYDAHFCGWAL